jgi:TolB protein
MDSRSKTLPRRDFTAGLLMGVGSLYLGNRSGDTLPTSTAPGLMGYTEYRTNLPGGRHANQVTAQACIVRADGSGRRVLLPQIGAKPFSWTQFAGWSPEGDEAVICCGWEDPRNGAWEEEHQSFRMTEGWRLDVGLLNLQTDRFRNLTAIERISEYNSGLFYWPGDENRLGFQALINGISHPFSMDRTGRNKTDLSNGPEGFSYGFSASPDGQRIAYHKDYQIFIAAADGSNAKRVETGNPFNFVPQWSMNGKWLLFVSGEHYNCHPYLVRSDGTGLRKIADRGGYSGVTTVYDVPDFHGGSSDVPIWSDDGDWIYYTAQVGASVELMRVSLDGQAERLTFSPQPGTLHYHPRLSPDGNWLLCGSNQSGRRQIHRISKEGGKLLQVTHVPEGWGAMWGHWQPAFTRR